MRPTDAGPADAPLTAVVVSGGGVGAAPGGPGAGPVAFGPPPAGLVPPGALVIAADSGLERALALGLRVDVVVGDLDSVGPAALAAAREAGAAVDAHPEAKDATDLELALDAAVARGAERVVVLGHDAGRLDHLLAGVALLAADRYAGVAVEAHLGTARLVVVRPGRPATLDGAAGDLVTLLAVGGPAGGVTTTGLLYPLRGEDLLPGSTRGVSNEIVAAPATVGVASGVLVAVLPGRPGTHVARGLGPRPGS